MKTKAYLSNVSKRWPLQRQEAVHAELTPGWPDVSTYMDKLSSRSLKAHSWLDLRQRSGLLRPTSRKAGDEIIYVASLAVLAWAPDDFMRVAAQAAARGAAIVAHDTQRRIEPTAGADELSAAVEEFQKARRAEQTGAGRRVGALASAKVRVNEAKARAERIREDWFKSDVPTAELLKRAGRRVNGRRVPMAYQTAVKILEYKRPAARKKADTDQLRELRRQETLERIDTHSAVRKPDWLDDVMGGDK